MLRRGPGPERHDHHARLPRRHVPAHPLAGVAHLRRRADHAGRCWPTWPAAGSAGAGGRCATTRWRPSLAGLNVARLQVLAFVISAACAGLGGALLAAGAAIVSPGAFTLTLSIGLLTAAVSAALAAWPGRSGGACCSSWYPSYLHQRGQQPRPVQPRSSSNVPIAAYGVVLIAVMLAVPGRNPGRRPPPARARGTRRSELLSAHCAGAGRPVNTRRKELDEKPASGKRWRLSPGWPPWPWSPPPAVPAGLVGSAAHRVQARRQRSDRIGAGHHGRRRSRSAATSRSPASPRPAMTRSHRRPTRTSSTSMPTAASTDARSSTSTSTTSTTPRSPRPSCTSSCCRTTSTRSSTGWARRPIWPSRRT